jgi:hypothetical protein
MAELADLALVTTPTETWLRENLRSCQERFLVASPYVGSVLLELMRSVAVAVKRTLVTRISLRDFAAGMSSIEVLCSLAEEGTKVFGLRGLHAKAYIVDDSRALVTSANATSGGLRHNWECGVAFARPEMVHALAEQVRTGFAAPEPPSIIPLEELTSYRRAAEVLRPVWPKEPSLREVLVFDEQAPPFQVTDPRKFMDALTGWTHLTFEGVLGVGDRDFSLDDLFALCEPRAREQYPNNKHVRAKLRQQLQRLRDREAVEFLGRGRYRKTFQVLRSEEH